jgi:hypothetical protein
VKGDGAAQGSLIFPHDILLCTVRRCNLWPYPCNLDQTWTFDVCFSKIQMKSLVGSFSRCVWKMSFDVSQCPNPSSVIRGGLALAWVVFWRLLLIDHSHWIWAERLERRPHLGPLFSPELKRFPRVTENVLNAIYSTKQFHYTILLLCMCIYNIYVFLICLFIYVLLIFNFLESPN